MNTADPSIDPLGRLGYEKAGELWCTDARLETCADTQQKHALFADTSSYTRMMPNWRAQSIGQLNT